MGLREIRLESINETFLPTDPGFGQRDPRWVGAWWLGFVICAGLSIIWAVPMLLFPSNLKSNKSSGQDKKEEVPKSAKEMAKGGQSFESWLRRTSSLYIICIIFFICSFTPYKFSSSCLYRAVSNAL